MIQFIYTFNSLDVPELRIRELVDLPIRPDGEVTPHARVRLEPHALDLAARGAEAVIRVLGRDARREDVLLDGPAFCEGERSLDRRETRRWRESRRRDGTGTSCSGRPSPSS